MAVDVGAVALLGSAVGGVTNLAIAGVAYRNREFPGAVPYGLLALAGSGWCFLTLAQMAASDPGTAETAHVIGSLLAAQLVALWLVFALVFTGRRGWLTPVRLAAVFLVPNVYGLVLLTAPLHGLVEVVAVPVTRDGVTLFTIQHGWAYAAQLVVSYGLLLCGYVLLGKFLLWPRNVYRRQTAAILVGAVFPTLTFGAFALGLTPHPGVNLTPAAFSLNAVFVGWALVEHGSLSVPMLGGEYLVDNLPDPVIALDDGDAVVYFNAAAAPLLDHPDPVGEHLDSLSAGLLDNIDSGEVFAMGEELTFYNPRTTSITDQFGIERGRLVVLRDVTGQQRRQDRLEALQAATQQFIGAETAESVAEMSVQFATRVLDQNAAAVCLADAEGGLSPAVVSEGVEKHVDADLLSVTPAEDTESSLWQTYANGEKRTVKLEGNDVGPLEAALMLPLGDHGVLAIGSKRASLATEDERYAEVLAQTTQVALDQVDRERQLRQSRSAVKRRREQIEFFNGVLRHSLHNAMVVIRGRAEHLHEDVSESKRHHLDSITEWCGRLTEMSETICDINDTVTASETERLEVVDLASAVRRSVGKVESNYPAAAVECEIDDELYVRANDLVDEVLLSILRNAVEHNDADRPEVTVGLQRASDWLQVRIADDGPGISDDLKTTVYERALSPDQTAGGFGIYFVSVMMELYGGTLWFEDNDPRGTVAVLEFQQSSATGFEADASARTIDAGEVKTVREAGSADGTAVPSDTDGSTADDGQTKTETDSADEPTSAKGDSRGGAAVDPRYSLFSGTRDRRPPSEAQSKSHDG